MAGIVLQRHYVVVTLPGYLVSADALAAKGFRPLEILRRSDFDISLPNGLGCNWDTIGDIPASPGIYAFTVQDEVELRVMYVGQTTHLWMVTKGRLPAGAGLYQARGGQRYGRPKHAGSTRKRVNALASAQMRAGMVVRHWVRPLTLDPNANEIAVQHALDQEEQNLIRRWDLRRVGWNLR